MSELTFYTIIHLISLFLPIFIVYTYIRIKGFRKQPGDIFTIIAVEEGIEIILEIFQNMNIVKKD